MKDNSRFLWYIFILILLILMIEKPTIILANNVEDCFEQGTNDCEFFDEENFDEPEKTIDQEAPENEANLPGLLEDQPKGPSLFSTFIKMIFTLLLILGLIYVMLKFVNRRHQLFQQTQTLENLGGISVGQNKSIQIIRVGTKLYLIGVGENVQLLKEIEDQEVHETLKHKKVEEPLTFKQWLKSFIPLKGQQNKVTEQNSFNHLLADELNKMQQNRKKVIDRIDKEEDTHE